MSGFDIRIDTHQLNRLVSDLAVTERQAQQALSSTLAKMTAWLRGQSSKGLAKAARIPLRVVRRRMKTFRLSRSASGSSVTLWYGLNPVGVIYLQAKQNKSGVRASGGRSYPSAFIKTIKGARQVFKRRGTKRLPIDKQEAAIEAEANRYFDGDLLGSGEFEERFFRIFEHELQWRMQTQR